MKRVILCLDGTWNNCRPGAILTNVRKLHQAIAPTDGNGMRQISHYIEGIVSAEGEPLKFLRGAIGVGVDDRIRKAYEILIRDYEAGDEIYLVGFSRGAFEARSLGGLITLFGVGRSGAAFSLDTAWSVYRTREKERDQRVLAELRAAAHYPVRIKCVAVWDTVGNLGNPFVSRGVVGRMFEFHDTRLTNNIDIALHALSIDELRGPFRPTLWTMRKGATLPVNQHVEQVWFAGNHADVGGGHPETGLSDVTLLWMAERIQSVTGLALEAETFVQTRPDSLGPQHSVAQGWIFTWSGFLPFIRLIKQAMEAIPPLRLKLLGTLRSGKLPRGEETINESIHDSVLERFGQQVIELHRERSRTITYEPRNLAPVIREHTALVAKSQRNASNCSGPVVQKASRS
jgi:uncharacterized protein (DUF2235 family)